MFVILLFSHRDVEGAIIIVLGDLVNQLWYKWHYGVYLFVWSGYNV